MLQFTYPFPFVLVFILSTPTHSTFLYRLIPGSGCGDMPSWQYITIWLASVSLAWAADSCFLTTDFTNIVPGQPVLLAWNKDVSSWWDVLLNTDVRTRASLVGSIARMSSSLGSPLWHGDRDTDANVALFWTGNITQSAVVWIPPVDVVAAEPKKLYAVQLWDLGRGTSCVSKTFRFNTSDQPPQPVGTSSLGSRCLRPRDVQVLI